MLLILKSDDFIKVSNGTDSILINDALADKISFVMREFAAGKLKDSHGKIVTDKKQALAIAYSEAKKMNNEGNIEWITVKGVHIPIMKGTNKKEVEELEEKKASGEKINEFDLIWKKSRIKDSEKDLRGFEKESKFIRWTTQTSSENFVRDTTYHEFGHVVMGRAEKIKDVDVWKKVESAFRKARKNGDIYNISQYSNKNRDEFFAETFAMRQTGQKLPDYVDEMLDYVININKGEQK